MLKSGRQTLLLGVFATVIGMVAVLAAAAWRSIVVNHAETTDSVIAGSAVDALLVGGLVVIGILFLVAAVVLFLISWWRSQHGGQDIETTFNTAEGTPPSLPNENLSVTTQNQQKTSDAQPQQNTQPPQPFR